MKSFYVSMLATLLLTQLGYAQNWYPPTGNVGIGTNAPEQKLTVVMDASENGSGIAVKAVNSGGAGSQPGVAFLNPSGSKRMYSYLDVFSDTYNIANGVGAPLMTINQAGNIGLGSTSPNAWFPGKVLEFSDARPILRMSPLLEGGIATILFKGAYNETPGSADEFH